MLSRDNSSIFEITLIGSLNEPYKRDLAFRTLSILGLKTLEEEGIQDPQVTTIMVAYIRDHSIIT